MEERNRIIQYDLIRTAAMLSVVVMHLIAHISAEPYGVKWWVKTAILLLVSTCNGLFFLLSGRFSLVNRNIGDPIGFYGKRIISILLPFIICSFICYETEKYLLGTETGYMESLISVFPGTHYWFVYELMGLVFWTPFFAAMMEKLDLRRKLIMTGIVLAFQGVFVFLKDIGIYPGYEFPLMGWPLFYLAGSFADEVPDKWKNRIMITGTVCYVISLLQMRFLPDASLGLQDMSPKYFFIVMAVYYALEKVRVPLWADGIVLFLARYSYYVYLFHNMLIMIFFSEELKVYDALINGTGTVLYLVITAMCSIGISLIFGIVIRKAIGLLTAGISGRQH